MIVRIVKMTFKDEHVEEFKEFSLNLKSKIRKQEGCTFLEILQDVTDPKVFFTCSHWLMEENLEQYRKSEFFNEVWPKAKQWFASKPEAWSLKSTDMNLFDADLR